MYKYNDFDEAFVRERVAQFRGQVARRIDGSLSEDEFKPLRLMNGLYLQLHAYMLRVAIPYGTLNSRQMNALAQIADTWDRGYGHFTTRQNIQFNWPKLADVPDMLDALADVEMHAIQTSGNTIRNVTADHFAGASADVLTLLYAAKARYLVSIPGGQLVVQALRRVAHARDQLVNDGLALAFQEHHRMPNVFAIGFAVH